MPDNLTISLTPEALQAGPAEERATFGLLAITANDRLLTEGADTASRQLRYGPHVSGYPLAEWFAWNWWRIRWELGRPSSPAPLTGEVDERPTGRDSARPSAEEAACRWDFAHRMPAIGEGYAWPNITVFSDGMQSFLESRPSGNPEGVLFRYFGASRRETVPTEELENTIDGFVEDMLSRLDGQELRATNLHRLWAELTEERENTEVARFRRLEAQLGCDPDEIDERAIHSRLRDAAALGEEALSEVAADTAYRRLEANSMMSAADIDRISDESGFDANPADAIALDDATDLPRAGEIEAWRMGERAARIVRNREGLNGQPVSDELLSEFAGTTGNVISERNRRSGDISFAFDRDIGRARLSLRSQWETGRRFELARLIGDRLLSGHTGRPAEQLFPATRAYSYRQKMQRAFAAELLSPFAAVEERLAGDYSEDMQNDIAEIFNVSPMTIRTQLLNNGLIDREEAPDIAVRGAIF